MEQMLSWHVPAVDQDIESGHQPIWNEDRSMAVVLTVKFTITSNFGMNWSLKDINS